MSSTDPSATTSRRSFLGASAATFGAAWLMAHWPQVAAAAHAAHENAIAEGGGGFKFLAVDEAADVEAATAQIIPSGDTPGAREAHVVYFIDAAFAAFFAAQAEDFRKGLAEFRAGCQAANAGTAFAALDQGKQHAYLGSVELTPFFGWLRFLTVAGLLASPKYGGNKDGLGWKMIGFEDNHVFTPPFGYYDRDYPGFVPYTDTGNKT
ncbi:MAG TPA: gluconate 2-dehydrogenase subunit 3 family protein [Steroidobacteraceae bacterium]|nr:gluconate 2-dehydrogenase subunit 3 family protein [Steroidobacteraceae bacterium]